jgi:hypothetical protein
MDGNHLEGRGRCLVEVLSCHFLEESEERRENFSQDSRCPSRDSNRAPPGYETRALPLRQTVLCLLRHLSSLYHGSNTSYEAPHCTVFYFPLLVTSSLLSPHILLGTSFSNSINLCYFPAARDQVSHPYKATHIHIILCTSYWSLLGYDIDPSNMLVPTFREGHSGSDEVGRPSVL